MNKLHEAVIDQLKTDLPEFNSGDTVELDVRVVEGGKERIQKYRGVVIARNGGGIEETVTVRKISNGIGVVLANFNVVRRGKVRRAKLHYLRSLTGKATRIVEKR